MVPIVHGGVEPQLTSQVGSATFLHGIEREVLTTGGVGFRRVLHVANVLVINDDIEIADAVAARLRADGHDVEVIHRGGTGLAAASNGTHDLVVLDLTPPGLDGIAICRATLPQHWLVAWNALNTDA